MTASMMSEWKVSELTGLNSAYLEGLYESYVADPSSVSADVRAYFDGLTQGNVKGEVNHSQIQSAFRQLATQPAARAVSSSGDPHRFVAIAELIDAYRAFGHLKAKLDPLGLQKRPDTADLSLEAYGLSSADLEHSFEIQELGYTSPVKLKTILEKLDQLYCGTVGIEYMHISDRKQKLWIRERIENQTSNFLTAPQKIKALKQLISADSMEKYLGMKYAGQKRFSLEGGDGLIPFLRELIEQAGTQGVESIAMGMAHRGRLNVLVNILGKPPAQLLAEFEGKHDIKLLAGDVKYHNGFSSDVRTDAGPIHVTLAFNPSHLEVVAPVVEGAVRARQARRSFNRSKVMAVHMHGDAAFCGQGVVMENFNMSQTKGYTTGGSIHIVINNQVGFTTSDPVEARSTVYCTDVAKMIEAPIFHVNGDDLESLIRVARLAVEYRMTFNKDVVIDLVCYRAHGHNEADEPSVTQPLMYEAIRKHPVPWKIYADQLVKEGTIRPTDADQFFKEYQARLEAGKPVAEIMDADAARVHGASWKPYLDVRWDAPYSAKIDKSELVQIAQLLEKIPAGFTMQKQVEKTMLDRAKMTRGELPLNWGYAETLAYATLLKQGIFVRMSGEDCERGTFAHRHAVLHDQRTGETYTPLQHVGQDPSHFVIINSVLSELAVLAFEYGFSTANPNALVIWEAQYGDFANMAQPIIDQFISSAEEKWGRLSGLVLFLPHGFEGQGAEHSSARLERYLQLCANDNMQVCVPTTPAQIFHLIRRQTLRPYRKPLVVMTPKSLLRHPLAISTLDDLANGEYQLVIPEVDALPTKAVKRVVLCQGRVYYDLLAARREAKIKDVAIIRIEQLYPFPEKALAFALKPYSHVNDIVWCQEEPRNQGAWYPFNHAIPKVLSATQVLTCVSRAPSASPAVGYPSLHKEQQEALIKNALTLK